jgi:hypothetical protein
LFLRDSKDPGKIEVRLFFDYKRATFPTIHIILPSENEVNQSIGHYDGAGEYVGVNGIEYKSLLYKRFSTTYQLVCTSENTYEVILLHHLMKYLLICFLDSLLINGFETMELSSQDLNLNQDLIPKAIFSRSIGINVSYDFAVPESARHKLATSLIFQEQVTNGNLVVVDTNSETVTFG